ncbi:aquaporin Z [Nocardioides abyssi]|uniref:Aquaporin Z n=1 Tax=Nocardioides abyssi TaxID=3058370 RepID=A0ABT8EVA6_9ACTN|nr:aquaporin Z [Nocardioides abyssi]MDN4161973.1 aquaporin Z [Nocardioides abyssi]
MPRPVPMPHRLAAEALGTFVLVLMGCGSAVLAAGFVSDDVHLGIGFLGVSLAFGLAVLTMAYAVGHVSGGHFNPAVTVGLAMGRRFAWRDAPAYVVAQVVGAVAAAAVLWVVASGRDGFSASASGFATNGYGDRSPGGYSLLAALVLEVVLTAVFLYVILGVTDTRAPKGFAPLAIGMSLTLIHLVSIPVTNTSVNPARSLGPALFAGGDALAQLWLFLLAPVLGALIAGATYALVAGRDEPTTTLESATKG